MRFRSNWIHLICYSLASISLLAGNELASAQQAATGAVRVVGTVQSISGKSLTVISDSGSRSIVLVEDATKFLQIEPGKIDLKEATPFTFVDLQQGDRVLVRGVLADDGKTIHAASLIAVKKAALAEKQAKDRAEWQRGVGGLVKSVDPSASAISVTSNALAGKEVVVHFTKDTIFRRYASDSTRFDAAKLAPLADIQAGDQLRARGTRTEGTADFNASEIVSGSFRNIAGTVISSDASNNILLVQDIASKTAVTLKINSESQMRKLPPQFAEGLAARLRNQSAGVGQSQTPAQTSPAQQPVQPPQQAATPGAAQGQRGAGGDFQQMIARMPAANLSDLQKGEAVMVVTTQGNGTDPLTVITLLGGVEPILRASPKGSQDMILSPWSLGGGEPSGN